MLVKQVYGAYFAIGGIENEIYSLWLSLFNWGALNGELIDFSDDFKYFLIEEDKYIYYRATAFANNWQNWWLKTHNGKLIWKLSQLKARKEFKSLKLENFLTKGTETFENNEFATGWIPHSLDNINLEKLNYESGPKICWDKKENY